MKKVLTVLTILVFLMSSVGVAFADRSGHRDMGHKRTYNYNYKYKYDYGNNNWSNGDMLGAFGVGALVGAVVAGSNTGTQSNPQGTDCRKTTTTRWENGKRIGSETTEQCDGYMSSPRY